VAMPQPYGLTRMSAGPWSIPAVVDTSHAPV
jgi:hypothetical protein